MFNETDATRVEIPFDVLYEGLLRQPDCEEQVKLASIGISKSKEWKAARNAYTDIAESREWARHAGDRRNRFADMINCILDEAPKHGLKISYAHEIRYGRYDYQGEIPASRNFWNSATAPVDPWSTWRRAPSPPHPSDFVPFERKRQP